MTVVGRSSGETLNSKSCELSCPSGPMCFCDGRTDTMTTYSSESMLDHEYSIQMSFKGNNINYPPYKPRAYGNELADKTLCGDHQHAFGSHYDTHNMYGWSESDATLFGVQDATGERGWILSRSTFVGSGRWAAHWLGDNFSKYKSSHVSNQ